MVYYKYEINFKGDDYMKVTIRVKNKVYLDDQAKEYIESKIGKLDQYFRNSENIEAHVLCKEYDDSKAVEVTIPTKNIILRAEVKEHTFMNAIDRVVDKLKSVYGNNIIKKASQVKKYIDEGVRGF